MILSLDVPLHQGHERDLHVHHQQRHAGVLEILRQAGVIDVKVRRHAVANFLGAGCRRDRGSRDRPDGAGPAEIDEETDPPALITQ